MKRGVRSILPLLMVAALACRASADPPRPRAVPKTALWLGGPDGGAFVLVKRAAKAPATFDAQIFHENGEVWYRGPMDLDPPGGNAPDVADRAVFSGWDGDRLILTDGRLLRPSRKPH